MRHWRDYLIGGSKDCLPFSHHAWAIVDPAAGSQDVVGGQKFDSSRYVISRVPYLLIVGLTNRKSLPRTDVNPLEATRVNAIGGMLPRLRALEIGKTEKLPQELSSVLVALQKRMFRRIIEGESLKRWRRKQRD